jgi:glycosyltransferase involved in cell wall biosynthesis
VAKKFPLRRDEPLPDKASAELVSIQPVKPIRVLHIAQTIAGGIASYFEEIASYQSELFGKANVNFLIPSDSEMHLPSVDQAQILTFTANTRRPAALLEFGQVARRVIRRLNPEVIHLHSSFAGAVVRTFLASSLERPRIIYCPHGWSFAMETAKPAKLAYAAIERILAARTDLILVNSASEYNLAVQFGIPPHKMRVVKNGIAWIPAPRRTGRSGPIRVAFIGRHDRQKGLDLLLDAIERFPLSHIHFDIVGERVVSRSGSRGASAPANVTLHGWLTRAETWALLQDVDAVVMPSRWEAFGLVAIEAMRAGVPVIGSNRGALPEVINHGVGGYIFDIDDPDALGRLLKSLDRNELSRLGASGRDLWEREYVADRMNRLTREAYEQVLASPADTEASPSSAVPHGTAPQLL